MTDLDRARALLRAIDRGGVPLDPAQVNGLARRLGMDVSRRAPMAATIDRLRTWVSREDQTMAIVRGSVSTDWHDDRTCGGCDGQ